MRWLSRPRLRVRPMGEIVSVISYVKVIMGTPWALAYLVSWVGPCVAQVEVQVEALTGCFGPL